MTDSTTMTGTRGALPLRVVLSMGADHAAGEWPRVLSLRAPNTYNLSMSPSDPRITAAGATMFLAPVSMQSYFASSRFRLLTQPSANGFLVYERLSGGM